MTTNNPPQQPQSLAIELEQALHKAVAQHQAGQSKDAEKLYQAILQIQPDHPVANHNMGVLAVQSKQAADGLPYFMAALDTDPACAQYWLSYIDALFQADQLETAQEVLALAQQQGLEGDEVDALAARLEGGIPVEESPTVSSTVSQDSTKEPKTQPTKPNKSVQKSASHKGNNPSYQEIDALVALFTKGRYTEAASLAQTMTERFPLHEFGWKALGAVFKELGRSADALAPMQKAAILAPNDVEAHYNLGVTLYNLGRLDEAKTSYRRALQINPNYTQAHGNLGTIFQELGRLDEAEASYRRALKISPDYIMAHSNLGAILQELGQLDDAEASIRRALKINPNYAEAHYNLGITLSKLDRLDEAEVSYRQALQLNPDYAEAHCNLGTILQKLDRPDEAKNSYRQALQINPDYAEAHNNLGTTLQKQEQLDEAESSFRRALQINPDYVEAHTNLGATLKILGRLDEAEVSYRQALQLNPDYAEAHGNLGTILHEQARLDEAEASFRRALKINPDYTETHNNLGNTLMGLHRLDEAEASFRQALQLKPDLAQAHSNLGTVLQDLGRLNEAEACYRRALQINPDLTIAYCNLGTFMLKRGQLDDAVKHFRQALEVKPDYTLAHSNMIFTLDLMTNKDASFLLEERKRWDAMHAAHLHQQLPHANSPDPERRLRIGYVSADFRDHSAAKAFGGMLTRYDRSQFEVFAYYNFMENNNTFTELFKQNVTAWRNIIGLSDDAVAKMIREDQIDVLIDLSGFTAGNRLLVFARKPAPIQITAWGYASGTGMQAMDVLFTDQVMVPPEDKQYFIEEVRYLPCMMGSFFNEPFPDVNELPALSTGIVTFGSFNRLEKISAEAYRAWAEVLLAVPRSKLVLKTHALANPETRESVIGHFTKAGVAADRIIMQGNTSWHEHMQAYHQVDIGLDPFPQGGGVTALEGLMMGVPVINLLGETLAGRSSASIMTTLGLTDWIVATPKEYVELAAKKASDLQSLAALRQQLRGIFTASVIGDQAAYARVVEQEYRQLWQEWCSKK